MKCRKCEIEKIDSEMVVKHQKIHNLCKECNRKISREYYAKNREKANQKRKQLYHDNREKFLESAKKRYQENREKIRERANKYNKTPERREKNRKYTLAYSKKNREKISKKVLDYKRKNPEKSKAHQYVLWGLKLEVLKRPEECADCLRILKVEAHHEDYSKPLEVVWLCRLCHMHRHNKLMDINPKALYDDSTGGFNFNSDSEEG